MKDYKAYARRGTDGWLHEAALLLFVLAMPFIQYLGKLPLMDPDEGRYAEIPREMLERGDFITPTLNYVAYFEKPPLLYWCNALSLKLFGLHEFAARLPSALCGLATVMATYLLARQLYDRRTGLLAAAILATSAGFVLQARIILTDMMVTLWLTAALGAFLVASLRFERPRDGIGPWYLFYLYCALAVLTKGLIGITLPVGIIGLYLLVTRRWELLARMRLGSGLVLFLAIAAPWFVVMAFKHPEFTHFFFVHEHVERFTSTVHGRYKPFWFFVPVLLVTLLPWSCHIPSALAKAWREQGRDTGRGGLFLVIWSLAIFLFFSLSDSKLVPYILPAYPPLAILMAYRIKGELERRSRGLKSATRLTGLVLLILGLGVAGYGWVPPAATWLADHWQSQADALRHFAMYSPQFGTAACLAGGGLLLFQGAIAFLGAPRKPGRVVAVLVFCSFLLEILIPRMIMGTIAQAESPREPALRAALLAGQDTRLMTFNSMPAVSWYAKRRVMVTGKLDELAFGAKMGDQSSWFPEQKALPALWREKKPLLLILRKNDFIGLQASLRPAPRIVTESGRYLLISNH